MDSSYFLITHAERKLNFIKNGFLPPPSRGNQEKLANIVEYRQLSTISADIGMPTMSE